MKGFSVRNNKGAAIMLAVFVTSFVIFLAGQIAEDSIMEYLASSTQVKKVQARHAATACVRLSLLRIKAYQQATRSLGNSLPDMSMLDKIWSFPLSWPPSLPKDLSSFDNASISKTVGGSLLKQQFVSEISAEGGRIDINDLGSPAESLRNRTKTQLLQRLQARVLNQEDAFAERYANFNFEELINNIADWIDADQESLNGGGERGYYSDIDSDFLPPNRGFKTLQELHMVAGMTDEIFEILAPQITLYGVKGINVNQAPEDVLLSLFNNETPEVAKEVVQEIIKRRNDPDLGGPFQDNNEFVGFLGAFIDTQEFNDGEDRVPLFFGAELNFRINCIGVSGKMTTEIDTVVYDAESVKGRLEDALRLETNDGQQRQKCLQEGKKDEALYACLCEKYPEGNERTQCIAAKKKAEKQLDQSNSKKQLPPGPPRVIFQQVK